MARQKKTVATSPTGADLATMLASGTPTEQKRAAGHALSLLPSHRSLIVSLLTSGDESIRAELQRALHLGPPYDERQLIRVLGHYTHPVLVRCLTQFECAFSLGLGVLPSDNELLSVLASIRDARPDGRAAWEALLEMLESTAPYAAAVLHIAIADYRGALVLLERSPVLPPWKIKLDDYEHAQRESLQATSLDRLGLGDEAREKWMAAAAHLLEALRARQGGNWRPQIRALRAFCLERLGLSADESEDLAPIASLRLAMSDVHVRGRLTALTEIRTVGSKKLLVREGTLSDETGAIGIVFWGDQTAAVHDGLDVEIVRGYVGHKYQTEEPQLTLGREGVLHVVQ
jgi:hypothetical protein